MLEKLLYIENVHTCRLEALNALMMFIEAVPDNIDALRMLLEALNLQAFSNDCGSVKVVLPGRLSAGGDKTIVFMPGGTISGKKEAADVLDSFLSFTEKTAESFQFWLGTINAVIAYLFPEAAERAGIEGASSARGFVQGTTPGDLASVLFKHITKKWFTEERYLSLFCNAQQIYGMLFDFLLAGAALPMDKYLATANGYLADFFTLIMYQTNFELPNVTREDRVRFQMKLLDVCAGFFETRFSRDTPELQKFVKGVIAHYVQCVGLLSKVDISTYKELLYSLLKASNNLLALPHTNPVLVGGTKNELLGLLFNTWIANYTIIDDPMWDAFQQTLAPLMDRSALISQVRYKLVHLTLLIRDVCYPITPAASAFASASAAAAAGTATASTGDNNNNNSSSSSSSSSERKKFKMKNVWTLESREWPDKPGLRESGLPQMEWDVNGLLGVWNILFQLLCGVNEVTNPTTYESVVLILTDVLDILIWAEDCSSVLPTEAELSMRIPLMPTFACILFSICKLGDPTRNAGMARAYGGLCRLFCRRNAVLPIELLSYFYAAVRYGLGLGVRLITWEIIVNSYNIFSLETPGALILVPEYVAAAKDLLVPQPSTSPDGNSSNSSSSNNSLLPNGSQAEVSLGSKKIVSMVVSLLSYPHQFQTLAVTPTAAATAAASSVPLGTGTYTAVVLRNALTATLSGALRNTALENEAKQMALWGLVVAAAEDITHFGGKQLPDLVDIIASCIRGCDDRGVQRAALQGLAYIGSTFATRLPPEFADRVIAAVARAITTMPQSRAACPTLVQGFLCMAVWLSAHIASSAFAEDTRTALFQAIDRGMTFGSSHHHASAVSVSGSPSLSVSPSSSSSLTSSSAAAAATATSDSSSSSSGQQNAADGNSSSTQGSSSLSGASVGAGGQSSGSGNAYEEPSSIATSSGTISGKSTRDKPKFFGSKKDRDNSPPPSPLSTSTSTSSSSSMSTAQQPLSPLVSSSSGTQQSGGSSSSNSSNSNNSGSNSQQQGDNLSSSSNNNNGDDTADDGNDADNNSDNMSVREAAEVLLRHMLYYRNNFPLREGVDLMTSGFIPQTVGSATPFADDELYNYVYNHSTVLSVAGINDGAAARVAIREPAGKWVWDFTPVHTAGDLGLEIDEAATVLDNYEYEYEEASTLSSVGYANNSLVCSLPPALSAENKLSGLFRRTQEANPELRVVTDTEAALHDFAAETGTTATQIEALSAAEDSAQPRERPPLPVEPENSADVRRALSGRDKTSAARQFMQQFGLLSPITRLSGRVERLAMSEKVGRSMLLFDKSPDRASHKIGLIYVREGQTTQNEILANSAGSPLYNDFVRGLGWTIDIATHRGYLGGIDKSFVAGSRAVYWANSLDEVIFHEVVAMPTSDTDHQQIHKKRHVGNDFVHIIWCEGLRDYNPFTITSQFNEAHIVIYPQEDGLCRIQIFRNLENTLFGPLQHGMVVPKDILPALVRETAVNADRIIASRITPEPFSRPFVKKKKMITDTFDRYKDTGTAGLSAKLSNLIMGEVYYSSDLQQLHKQQQQQQQKTPPSQ